MIFNPRIAISLASIAAAGALVVGGTFAFFSDSSSSNSNVFRSGTLDLKVADNNEPFANSVATSFQTPADWAPGQKHVDFICFKNDGSVDIEQVLLTLTSPDAGATTLDNFVYVSNIELGPVSSGQCASAGTVGTEGLVNFKALFDTRFGVNAPLSSLLAQIDGTNVVDDDLLDGPAKLAPADIMKFRVEWTFDPAATSSEAGKTVTLNIGFNATQNEQP
jgi:predicted ribosomally synthesized peptide with SipW-like signal peptide